MSDTPRTPSTEPKSPLGTGEGTPSGVAREAREFGQAAKAQAQRTAQQTSQALSSGMDAAQARMADFTDWANTQHETIRERTREHPITYLSLSFCAGIVFGLLLSRR